MYVYSSTTTIIIIMQRNVSWIWIQVDKIIIYVV